MPIQWVIAPIKTKKCQIKWEIFVFNAKGISPKLYAIPPPRINRKNPTSVFNIFGSKIKALQPKSTYNAMCNGRKRWGPNTPMNVMPVKIIAHCTIKKINPYIPPMKQSKMGANVAPINR